MKSLIAALLIVSSPVFGGPVDATEALLSTLPTGEYSGETLIGNKSCLIWVRDLSNKVVVEAAAEGMRKRSQIVSGYSYLWRPQTRFFQSIVITENNSGSLQNIFRTIAISPGVQYVMVADQVIDNRHGEITEEKIECVLDL